MTDFTPGPWQAAPTVADDKEWAIMAFDPIDHGGHAVFVAQEVESEADATLIAAAPDLAEALAALLEEVEYQMDVGGFAARLSIREQARAALAKALPSSSQVVGR